MDDNTLRIRPMEETDIPQVSTLYREMYQEQEEYGMTLQFCGDTVETMLASWIQSKFYLCFVAETEAGIKGFSVGSLSRFSNKYSYGSQPFFGFIHDIFVVRHWRRTGLGQQLMDTLEHAFRAQGIELIELHVLAGNQPAQSFWQRNGYQDVVRIMYKKL